MLVTIDLSEEDIKILNDRQIFRMNWIKAEMDEKEPLDYTIQKILNAALLQQKTRMRKNHLIALFKKS